MEIRPKWDKTKLVSHFGGGSYVKGEGEEGEEEEEKKKRKTYGNVWNLLSFVWNCIDFWTFVWILVCSISRV